MYANERHKGTEVELKKQGKDNKIVPLVSSIEVNIFSFFFFNN